MTASVSLLRFAKSSPEQGHYIRPVTCESEDVRRALASRRQVELKYPPSILHVCRGPKLPVHNGERCELSNTTALSLTPFLKKLRHARASLSSCTGTFMFLSRNVNYAFPVCSAISTEGRYNASHERQAGHP